MKKDELISGLAKLGVNESSYSLGVMRNSECVCVVEGEGKWKVFYVERDKPQELAAFEAEEQAYSFVYENFCKWLGVRKD